MNKGRSIYISLAVIFLASGADAAVPQNYHKWFLEVSNGTFNCADECGGEDNAAVGRELFRVADCAADAARWNYDFKVGPK